MRNSTSILLLLTTCITLAASYHYLNTYNEIMLYYEQNSYTPIMHVYYNRHFSKSKQFQLFLSTLEQVQFQVNSYAKILLTDCQHQKSDDNVPCKEIKRLNQNRMILGYMPTNKFTTFGDKIMQSPPQNKIFDHFSDVYTVQEFVRFINQLVPNFLKQIKNTNQFQNFKNPKYVPKLIFTGPQGEIPQVMKQLSTEFFLKFDMAYIDDLTQSVVNMLEIKHFPSLMILKHNFQTSKLEIFQYDSQDFSENQHDKIRRFLQLHALKQRRNDYVFHLIKMPTTADIYTVYNRASLDQYLNRVQSWIFLQQGPSLTKLLQIKNNYGRFYDYVHYYKPQVNESKLYLINQRNGVKFDYQQSKVGYRMVNSQQLYSNITIWLKKHYVVMAVKQQHGYICTIVDKPLFAGLTQCFIIRNDSYPQLQQKINLKFTHGFILSAKTTITNTNSNQSLKVKGNDINNLNYQQIYRMLEYTTRMKVKDIIEEFIDHPVKKLIEDTTVEELCTEPFKKCILYFYQSSNDNTKLQYLELQARDFVNEYKFYSINLTCNQHLYQQIPQLKDSHGGLIAYYPRLNKFVYLKAKMNRNVIKKFLEINNQDKKSLPFKAFTTTDTGLNACRGSKLVVNQKQAQSAPNDEIFAQQL